jgi:hypothetical protein
MKRRFISALCAMCLASGLSGSASAQEKTWTVGGWDVLQVTDAFSDKSRTIISLEQANNLLIIKCDSPGSVYVSTALLKDWIGKGQYTFRDVLLRFDAKPAYKQPWAHDDRTVSLLISEDANAFVRQLLGARKLAMRVWDYDGDQHDAMFEIPAETRSAMDVVYQGCAAGPVPQASGEAVAG